MPSCDSVFGHEGFRKPSELVPLSDIRLDKAAQWEIRQYAIAVTSIVKELFPRTWELFDEEMFNR